MKDATTIANGIIQAIVDGKLVATTKSNCNFKNIIEIDINRAEGAPQYGHDDVLVKRLRKDMPEEWTCFEYSGTDGCLLYRTNGFCTEFVSVNPEATRGAYAMGEVKTDKGIVNVEGGWSSRASILHKYTGIELIDMYIGHVPFHVNKDIATAIGEHLGYVVDESMYTIGKDDEEQAWAFYEKDTHRCAGCNKPHRYPLHKYCNDCAPDF